MIHHNACGGRVRRSFTTGLWDCVGCGRSWGQFQVDRFGDDGLAVRFHLRGDVDPESYAIVWKTVGRNRFTTLVPVSEADGYERLVL